MVNFWSPFTIGVAFPTEVIMSKKNYIRGDIPVRTDLPPVLAELEGGPILNLPEEGIEAYMKS